MDDIVVCPLGKGAIDVAEWQQSFLGHSSGEGDGMSLGNADVEGALGHFLHHNVHRAARRHGRRDTDNPGVLPGQFEQRLSKDILETRRVVLVVVNQALAGLRVEFSRGVPHCDIPLGRGVAMAFLGVQVQQLGTFHSL